jgi:hypothetical protein
MHVLENSLGVTSSSEATHARKSPLTEKKIDKRMIEKMFRLSIMAKTNN